jgi:hypothetical protein
MRITVTGERVEIDKVKQILTHLLPQSPLSHPMQTPKLIGGGGGFCKTQMLSQFPQHNSHTTTTNGPTLAQMIRSFCHSRIRYAPFLKFFKSDISSRNEFSS